MQWYKATDDRLGRYRVKADRFVRTVEEGPLLWYRGQRFTRIAWLWMGWVTVTALYRTERGAHGELSDLTDNLPEPSNFP